MTTLARKLRLVDYFALGFGVMVGTAWLVVMDDLLQRGGPLGALLGFTAGALMLLPIGYVYGQLVRAIPDAGAEIAYTAKVFPGWVSFATGWMMFLAYFLTCPFEALAAGRITGADHHSVFYMAELSRDSRQREVPENYDVHVSEPGGAVRAGRCKTRFIREFPSVVQSRATDFHSAGLAGGALAAFGLRVCGEMRGRGQPGFS